MSETDERGARWTDSWIALALVAAAAAAIFLPTLFGEFVHDDHASVVTNPFVQAPPSWLRLLTDAGAADPYGYVRPLRTLEFAVDRALFGAGPFAFHVHSLLWHVAAAVVLLLVLRRLLGHSSAALVATLLWAVHPAHVEAVAWISSRGDMAMGACSLVAILFALRSEGFDRNLAVSLVAAAVAPLYKETALALWVVVAALRWTKTVRVPVWPYVAVAAAYGAFRFCLSADPIVRHAVVIGGDAVGTFATMSRAFGFYLAETLLPAQSLDWYMTPSTSFADGAVIAWLAVHAALIASAFAARRRAPLWTLAVVWFYAFLLPVANWPVSVGKPTSERYLYLSVAGAAIAVGASLVCAPRAAWAATLAIVAAFGAASIHRARMWRSDDDLMTAVLADHDSPGARYHFAARARAEALSLRDRALRMPESPERAEAIAKTRGLIEESLAHAHRAIGIWRKFDRTAPPKSPVLRRFEVLASTDCYLLLRHDEALFHAEEALRIDESADGYAHYDRAMPLYALGYEPQAMASMRRARELGHPADDAEVGGFFLRAAAACEAKGLLATALAGYDTAVVAAPDGPIRREAQARRDALARRDRSAGDDAIEQARLRRLDETLAGVTRSCPDR